jgi:hypothetical protein
MKPPPHGLEKILKDPYLWGNHSPKKKDAKITFLPYLVALDPLKKVGGCMAGLGFRV